MKDNVFETKMTKLEKEAWQSFTEVVKNFLGNTKSKNYKKLVKDMLQKFQNLGCKMKSKKKNFKK